jgi:hypothetical protein
MMEWISWSNGFYLVGLIVAGVATVMAAKYKSVMKEVGEVVDKLQEGYADGKLTKQEKEAIMKEVLDVLKSVMKLKWGF